MQTIEINSPKELPKDKNFHCVVATPNPLEAITIFKSNYQCEPDEIYHHVNSHGTSAWYIPVNDNKDST